MAAVNMFLKIYIYNDFNLCCFVRAKKRREINGIIWGESTINQMDDEMKHLLLA